MKILTFLRQIKAAKRRKEFQDARDEWLQMSSGVAFIRAYDLQYREEPFCSVQLFGIHPNNHRQSEQIGLKSVNAVSVAVICGAKACYSDYSGYSWIVNREFIGEENERCVVPLTERYSRSLSGNYANTRGIIFNDDNYEFGACACLGDYYGIR